MLKRLLILATALTVTMTSASAQMSVEDKERKYLTTFLSASAVSYLMGSQNTYQFLTVSRPINAETVAAEFGDNEIAAYKKYKDQNLYVAGVVGKIRQSGSNTIELAFITPHVEDVVLLANFDMMSSDQIAEYHVGQPISLTCGGGIVREENPTLKRCTVAPPVTKIAQKTGEYIAQTFLSGSAIDDMVKSNDDMPLPIYLFILKYVASKMPDDSPCFNFDTFAKCDSSKYINKSMLMSKGFAEAYQSGKEKYHLPDYNWNK